jgi:hypothetical protein
LKLAAAGRHQHVAGTDGAMPTYVRSTESEQCAEEAESTPSSIVLPTRRFVSDGAADVGRLLSLT